MFYFATNKLYYSPLTGRYFERIFFDKHFPDYELFSTINSISYVILLLSPYIDTGVRLAIIV